MTATASPIEGQRFMVDKPDKPDAKVDKPEKLERVEKVVLRGIELVPEKIDGAVVLNVMNNCLTCNSDCIACSDFAIGLHNWLITTDLKYVIFDLQDEKEVCPIFLEEILQLWKRMKFPFLFAGVMERPRVMLEAYNYALKFPLFVTPGEAIDALRGKFPSMLIASFANIQFGHPIPITRPRFGVRPDEGEGDAEAEGDVDEAGGDDDAD